ncbi:unnamed protein product [Prorocentrum cordatum]|uniref:Uncharacterized protein n=1 Tax=Prorocentrum cordatum TaxID=2364126 RepID=A0ABN9R6S7_9DINO|nr:unnamed protein product [Polarella glacialis]
MPLGRSRPRIDSMDLGFASAMAGNLPSAAQVMFGAVLGFKVAKFEGKQLHSAVAAAARGAVQGSASGAAPGEDAGAAGWEPLESFETLPNQIRVCAGLERKPSITQAKSLLRDKGAGQLASRLGKISQLRNVAGRPDVFLQEDIHKVFDGVPAKEENEPGYEGIIGTKIEAIERQLERLSAKLEQTSGLQVPVSEAAHFDIGSVGDTTESIDCNSTTNDGIDNHSATRTTRRRGC